MNHVTVISVGIAILLAMICLFVLPAPQFFGPHNLLPSVAGDDELYPRPREVPESTNRPLPELLREYELVVKELSPSAHATLQPGLSTGELDELEQKYSTVLSRDIRLLYSWKNGSETSQAINVFPYMRFVPLQEALERRDHFRNAMNDAPDESQKLSADWLGHRYAWVGVIENSAGDGYFYDPDRRDQSSSFFFHGHDEVGYLFYPAIGNYIEELLDLHRSAQLSAGETGLTLEYEWTYEEEKAFLNRFGRWME